MTIVGEYGALLKVRKEFVDLDRVASDLWISNKDYEKQKKLGYKSVLQPGICLWQEDEEFIYLPRGYVVPLVTPDYPEWKRKLPTWKDTGDWPIRIKLLAHQADSFQSLIRKSGDKLLCLGCGKGKTIQALLYAATRQVKTLVIVDRDFLADQWLGEIKKCFWFPNVSVGRVQAQDRTVGEKLTIALVHTLSQQEFPKEFYDQFGLVIYDECQSAGAPTFIDVLPLFAGERLLLSATPHRRDGMEAAFMLHGGGMTPVYTDLSREQASSWYFVQLPRIISEEDENACYRRIPGLTKRVKDRWGRSVEQGTYAINRPIYDTKASMSEVFNRIIVDDIMKAAKAGRNVLVLGGRVEQLEALSIVIGDYYETGLVTGLVKGDERRAAFKKQILFCTDKIGSRALDVPRLDTLILLSPTKDPDFIRQTVGRIDREHEGKGKPLVVVYCHKTLEKLEKGMQEAIEEVDNRAAIKRIRRG